MWDGSSLQELVRLDILQAYLKFSENSWGRGLEVLIWSMKINTPTKFIKVFLAIE